MDTLADLPGGAHQSVPVVALDSPSAAHHRRSSTFFPLRADTSPTDAAAAPTVAGAAAAGQLEREIYMDELAQSQEDIARLQREAETAEKAREAAESKVKPAVKPAVKQVIASKITLWDCAVAGRSSYSSPKVVWLI